MIEFDPRVGKMMARKFRKLQVLTSENSGEELLPPSLLPGDAVGARTHYQQDLPQVIVFGRQAFYFKHLEQAWTTLPYADIVDRFGEVTPIETWGQPRPYRPELMGLVTADGGTQILYTSEYNGLVGHLFRKAKNCRYLTSLARYQHWIDQLVSLAPCEAVQHELIPDQTVNQRAAVAELVQQARNDAIQDVLTLIQTDYEVFRHGHPLTGGPFWPKSADDFKRRLDGQEWPALE
jgi:hypothetical protein